MKKTIALLVNETIRYPMNRDSYSLNKVNNTLRCFTYLDNITDHARLSMLYAKQVYHNKNHQ